MRVIVTAGPTREYIDPVRFITNASSGRMGVCVASAAADAGHDVTLLLGACEAEGPAGVQTVRFRTVGELSDALHERFAACDALVMAAAVGDFRPAQPLPTKIPRRGGPITLRLLPTEDILGSLRPRKRPQQRIVAFAVEDGDEARAAEKARTEMRDKGADFVVANAPDAMGASASRACILAPDSVVLGWARREKAELAAAIVDLLSRKA
jgi:phosphopantothenoylcysteine decarboxylase/phosphopantothenate--cysteine ligase